MNRLARPGYAILFACLCALVPFLLTTPTSKANTLPPTNSLLVDEGTRLSDMGPDGDTSFFAHWPAVAFNPNANEYLVVWVGYDGTTNPLVGDQEIYGQRIDATTGAAIGENDFRISDMGPDGAIGYEVYNPDVIYNPDLNEYLVVWRGDDVHGPGENENEVYVQRIDATTGNEVGANDFRVSVSGIDGNAVRDAFMPHAVYNSTAQEYLVVWYGDHQVNNKMTIYGQRLDATDLTELGIDDFQISDMGPTSDAAYDARSPRAAYNPIDDEYLVVWYGNDNIRPVNRWRSRGVWSKTQRK